MNGEAIETSDEGEWTPARDRRQRRIELLMWLLGVLWSAAAVWLVWILAQWQRLDADMNVINAARGG